MILACSRKEISQEPKQIISEEICFTAYSNDEGPKTERQSDGSVFWNPGDAVSLFFNKGDHGGNRFVAQNTEVSAIAEFKGTITGFAGGGESTGGEFWFWGVYPYSEDNSCDGTSITLTLPALQTANAGSFANGLFPTMARSKGLELGFYNICGGFRFSVSRDDIKAVKFRGNADEDIAGKARIQWDENGHPAVVEHVDGKKEITVSAPNDENFVPGEDYYIVFYPELLSNGFTLSFITSNSKQGDFSYSSSRQINRGIFINAPNLDQYVTSWSDIDSPNPVATPEGGTESGLYLGLTYFGSSLSNYPAQLLTEESISGFNAFIDNRTDLDDETLLYYTVDKSMSRLQANRFPDDLFSVAIVTFTDGQDDGSVGWKEDETGRTYYKGDYERELAEILEGTVQNVSVMAYSVGKKQAGVTSNTAFINSLQTIAHPSSNYTLANNMSEVNERFSAIAQELSNTIKLQKLIGTIPRQATGTRIRFTYDNIQSGANSSLYIEGVYYSTDYSLRNVDYKGLTSTSGTTVVGVRNKNKVTFTFEGVHRENNVDVNMDYFKRWIYNTDTSEWEEYVETSFQPGENGIVREMKSAAIILNIDCTESLGSSNFNLLKQYSKNFINTLYTSSIDPEAVQRVTLNKSTMKIAVGGIEKLIATVSPSTAIDKSIMWSSSDASIATVSSEGVVTGIVAGTAVITATTTDGGFTADCGVTVVNPVTGVSLDKTELQISKGKTETLTATITPSNALNPYVTWSSSNTAVATVSPAGVVTGLKDGTAVITVTTVDGGFTADCGVRVITEMVDLGLSVKWASSNLGAINTEEYGDRYAWGETEPKDNYSWTNYKFRTSGSSYKTVHFSKYNTNSSYGPIDNKTILDPEDDAATVELGSSWRIPTYDEWQELIDNCNAEWTFLNEVKGIKLTSNIPGFTNRWIFLPALAPTYYWSSTLETEKPYEAKWKCFYGGPGVPVYSEGDLGRFSGFRIRPVCGYDDIIHVSGISLNKTSLSVYIGDSCKLTVAIYPLNATNKQVIWSSSNVDAVTIDADGNIMAIGTGTANVIATTVDGHFSTTCQITVKAVSELTEQGINFRKVDLGLPSGLKWAEQNLGASLFSQPGNYYAWGETEPKDEYNWINYRFKATGDANDNVKFSKYVTCGSYGSVDNRTILDLEDDAAACALGGKWRIPTKEDWIELRDNCTWTWVTSIKQGSIIFNVSGIKVSSNRTGYTEKWIFLRAAGSQSGADFGGSSYGDYWSSSLYPDDLSKAYYMYFESGKIDLYDLFRYVGRSIRPVCE